MRLLVMSFDGETKLETPVFKDVADVWSYSNDIGSKWHFYPFHFAVTDSGKTIKDVPCAFWDFMIGARVNTISRRLAELSKLPAADGMDAEQYTYFVCNNFDKIEEI